MAARSAHLLILASTLLFAACASLQPNLGPDKTAADTYNAQPTLPNAVKVGQSMRERYVDSVENRLVWERLSGAGLIGMTAIAADLAMRGVGQSAVIGLGVGAGATYAGSTWLNPKPHQFIYAAGANAVQCALDAMLPLSLAYGVDVANGSTSNRSRLAASIPKIQRQADALDATLKRDFANAGAANLPNVVRARAAVERARALLPQARQALGVLDGAGPRLRSALSGIQLQVTRAVVDSSPDLHALVDALGKQLPASGSRILGVPLPGVPVPTEAGKKSSGSDADLVAPTHALENLLEDAEYVVELVRARPSDDVLRQCNVDLRQAGLEMVVTPGALTLRPGEPGATIGLSGGVLPYRAMWIGTRPAEDQVKLQVETGRGEVTVVATASAKPGDSYTLLITDAARARETVPVVIASTTPADSGKKNDAAPEPAAGTPAACSKDSLLERVQMALIKNGIKTVKVDGKEQALVQDGCMGPVSRTAMRNFYKSQLPNPSDDQIPKDDKQLLNEVAGLLGVKA